MRWIKHNPALFGYLVSAVIFTCLLYVLIFAVRDDNLAQCARNNAFRAEVNKRAPKINLLIHLERIEAKQGEFGHGAALHRLTHVHDVRLVDCESKFRPPFPF